ncbi:MAG: hypothetical protein RR619_04695 [Raoultibacter sp.]
MNDRSHSMSNEPRADPVATTHYEEVVPYWLATLAVGVCRAYRVAPTVAAVDAIIEESYETAYRLFLEEAKAQGRIEEEPAATAAEGHTGSE